METKNGCGDARGGELFQFVAEILAIRAGHDDAFEYSLAVPAADVGEHIGVHVGIVVEFGFGEDGETDVAEGFHPGRTTSAPPGATLVNTVAPVRYEFPTVRTAAVIDL